MFLVIFLFGMMLYDAWDDQGDLLLHGPLEFQHSLIAIYHIPVLESLWDIMLISHHRLPPVACPQTMW